jgi:uncharacterized protein DUF3313
MEVKMKRIIVALLMVGLAGCSVTEQSKPDTVVKTGFLADYSQLKPGAKDQALLVYINQNVNWKQYHSVLLESVQVWDSPDRQVSAQDEQTLSSYYYNALKQNLSKNFKMVAQPGPGVMTIRVALVDATTATPGLRTVSVVVPQARILSAVTNLGTGSYAFVGSAQSEGEILDSVTGERLAAAVDRRSGGMSIKNADAWEWGDAEKAMDYWAQRLDQRLVELRSGQKVSSQ